MTGWIADWLEKHPAPPQTARPEGIEISYSHLRVFLQCPWQYHLRYRKRLRTSPTPASALGMSIHRALEDFHAEDGGDLDLLRELYEAHWVHEGFSSPAEQMEYHAKGEAILRRYWEVEKDSRSEIVAVEKEFLFLIGPHQVIGMIDRIDRRPDGSYEVIDYKSHLEISTEEQAAGNLQLGIYGLGAREGLAVEPSWLSIYYVAAGKKVSVPYDPSREIEIKALIARACDLIASGRAFRPDTSFCPHCALADRCDRRL